MSNPSAAPSAVASSHRLEAFCDGVLAIAITLLVLEIRAPILEHASAALLWEALVQRWPVVLATILSFAAIASYWVNHHHMMRALRGVDHGFILLTLLWLLAVCLMPFATAVLGEYMLHDDSIVVAAPFYLGSLMLPSLSWCLGWLWARRRALVNPAISSAQLRRLDGMFVVSTALHGLWVILAFWWPWWALGLGLIQVLSYLRPVNFAAPKSH